MASVEFFEVKRTQVGIQFSGRHLHPQGRLACILQAFTGTRACRDMEGSGPGPQWLSHGMPAQHAQQVRGPTRTERAVLGESVQDIKTFLVGEFRPLSCELGTSHASFAACEVTAHALCYNRPRPRPSASMNCKSLNSFSHAVPFYAAAGRGRVCAVAAQMGASDRC